MYKSFKKEEAKLFSISHPSKRRILEILGAFEVFQVSYGRCPKVRKYGISSRPKSTQNLLLNLFILKLEGPDSWKKSKNIKLNKGYKTMV